MEYTIYRHGMSGDMANITGGFVNVLEKLDLADNSDMRSPDESTFQSGDA